MPYTNYGDIACSLCGRSIKDGAMIDLTEDTSLVWCSDCCGYKRWNPVEDAKK